MSKKKIYAILLGLIILLGFVLRVVNLKDSPPGFNADEASLGYNAYSILKTGKDEWGERFPLVFKSFSDYKPGLYVYLTVPSVAVLGLNEFSVRFPSIILGSLSILLIFYLAKELFANEVVSLTCAFLLAISPWHIHFSRAAWETNVATFFLLLGVTTFVRSIKYSKGLIIPVVSFIAAMYAYQATRLVVPLLALALAWLYRKNIFIKKSIYPLIIAIILLVPFMATILGNKGLERFQGLSFLSDIGPTLENNQVRGDYSDPSGLGARIYHNRVIAYSLNFINHYLDHYNPNFLFVNGDPVSRNNVPEMGQMYPFEILTILFGIYLLITKKYKDSKILWCWLFIAPIAAALTFQTPSAVRAENEVIPLTLMSGLGLGWLLEKLWIQKTVFKYPRLVATVLVVFFFIGRFTDEYFIHLPKQYGKDWQYGYSQVVNSVNLQKDKYKKIIVSDKNGQPYIFFLFYSQYDPAKYRETARSSGTDKFGFSTTLSFDKYEFRTFDKDEIKKGKDTLYVTAGEGLDKNQVPQSIINYPNGQNAFKIIGS